MKECISYLASGDKHSMTDFCFLNNLKVCRIWIVNVTLIYEVLIGVVSIDESHWEIINVSIIEFFVAIVLLRYYWKQKIMLILLLRKRKLYIDKFVHDQGHYKKQLCTENTLHLIFFPVSLEVWDMLNWHNLLLFHKALCQIRQREIDVQQTIFCTNICTTKR